MQFLFVTKFIFVLIVLGIVLTLVIPELTFFPD